MLSRSPTSVGEALPYTPPWLLLDRTKDTMEFIQGHLFRPLPDDRCAKRIPASRLCCVEARSFGVRQLAAAFAEASLLVVPL